MKRLYAKGSGDRLYRRMIVRVFTPGNESKKTYRFTAKPGQGFNDESIHKTLEQMVDDVDHQHPDHVYRLVELRPYEFNIVWEELRTPTVRRREREQAQQAS